MLLHPCVVLYLEIVLSKMTGDSGLISSNVHEIHLKSIIQKAAPRRGHHDISEM